MQSAILLGIGGIAVAPDALNQASVAVFCAISWIQFLTPIEVVR